jgi:starch phosphorylase
LSTLDGWWDEAWRENGSHLIGWAIGRDETYPNQEVQDQVEAEALYELLEGDVVPTFYHRGADRLPRNWIERMKASLAGLCHRFNTHRMVQEYVESFYLPAHDRCQRLNADDASRAKALAAWKERVRSNWSQVRVEAVENQSPVTLPVGQPIHARVRVHLGALTPADVSIELYHGRLNSDGEIVNAVATAMNATGEGQGGSYSFEAHPVSCADSGQHGFTVRVLPHNPDLASALIPGLISWA